MSILCRKLTIVWSALIELNSNHGNLHTNVQIARYNFSEVQHEMITNDSLELKIKE